MRIAIIGAGISGLTAAYKLQIDHDIVLYDANDYVGGHTHTVDVEQHGKLYAVDTGFIVFNHETYPEFTKLLDDWHVPSQPTRMSFSVRCERSGLEYGGVGLNGLFTQRSNVVNVRFYQMLRDFFRFGILARELIQSDDNSETVGEFLQRNRFSAAFRDWYFLPMGSAVWSCPHEAFEGFPIRFIAEFYHNHGMLSAYKRPLWRVIKGGSRTYVGAMLSRFCGEVRTSSPIESVRRSEYGVVVKAKQGDAQLYDHVILSCHADQSLRMLGEEARETERHLLGCFPYEKNHVVLHTDTKLLPRSQRAWACWNYRIPASKGRTAEKATVTYNMNLLQSLVSPEPFLVTLNDDSIDCSKILREFTYHHPVFDKRRWTAQDRHDELIDRDGISFCGAYWRNGFHEDGVVSALRVCRRLQDRQLNEQRTLRGLGAASAAHAG